MLLVLQEEPIFVVKTAKVLNLNYLFIVFILCFLIQQCFYWILFSRLAFSRLPNETDVSHSGVSVVICGKNEAANFTDHLPAFLSQKHSDFEIVVVDDHSNDNTQEVLKSLKREYKHLTIVPPSEVPDKPGKKAALAIGVSQARFENILVTDADCRPASDQWLSLMASPLSDGNDLVLGIAPLDKAKGLLNKLIRFETYLTALQYASYVYAGIPYMGVGRNMGYKKDTFMATKEELLNDGLASGDDDLLVNKVAKPGSTALVLDKNSFTYSPAMPTWKKWLRQKSRHYTAGGHYKTKHKVLLSLFNLSLIGYNWLLIPVLFSSFTFLAVIVIFGNILFKNVIHFFTSKKLDHTDIILENPFLEWIWAFLMPYMGLKSYLMSKKQWN